MARFSYLQDCAAEAEVATEFLYIEDIGLGEKGQFTDMQDQVISNLFKLYPWEYMLREMFPPSWKMLACAGWSRPGRALSLTKPCCRCSGRCSQTPDLLPAYFAEDDYPQMGEIRR